MTLHTYLALYRQYINEEQHWAVALVRGEGFFSAERSARENCPEGYRFHSLDYLNTLTLDNTGFLLLTEI